MKRNLITSLIIIAAMGLFHCLLYVWPSFSVSVYMNYLRPCFFLAAAVTTFFLLGGRLAPNRSKNNTFLICSIAAAAYIFLLLLSGIIGSFARNAMAPSFRVVMRNLWTYGAVYLAIEYIRLAMIRRVDAKHSWWFDLILAVVFAFVSIENIRFLFGNGNGAESIAVTIVPALLVSFFLTFAAAGGTFGGLLIFRFAVTLVPYVLPIIPNVNKFLLVIFLCVVVFTSYLLLDKYRFDERKKTLVKKDKYRWKGYLVPLALIAVLVMFGAGVFPVKPVAVASDSMKGAFERGSIVMVKKMNTEKTLLTVKVDDVIQFDDGRRQIMHRVIEIRTDNYGEVYYITKGDNNNAADTKPVYAKDVRGIGTFFIPYLGYPSVWFSGN